MARVINKNTQVVQKKETGAKKTKKQKVKKVKKPLNKMNLILGIASALIVIAAITVLIIVLVDKKDTTSEAEDNKIVQLVDSYFDDYKEMNAQDRPEFGPRIAIKNTSQLLVVNINGNTNKPMPDNYYIYVYNSDYGDEEEDNICRDIEEADDSILKLMNKVIASGADGTAGLYLYIVDLNDASNSTTLVSEDGLFDETVDFTLTAPMLIKVTDEKAETIVSQEISASATGMVAKIKAEIGKIS